MCIVRCLSVFIYFDSMNCVPTIKLECVPWFLLCVHRYRPLVNSHICNWFIYDLPNCDVDIGFDFELCLCSPKVECGPSPNACCTEYEQQPVDIVQYRLFSFVLHHWLCSLHAHCSRQTNQTPISKIAKMNYSIRFCAIDLIVPSSQLYSIHFHAFRRQYPVWLFMFFFSFFTQKQETLQHSVRTLQSSDFFFFFCVIFFISTNVVLVHSGWIENAAFSWSAKCGAWVETINISNDRKNQI